MQKRQNLILIGLYETMFWMLKFLAAVYLYLGHHYYEYKAFFICLAYRRLKLVYVLRNSGTLGGLNKVIIK